jgi:hypothetical protein
MATRDMLVYQAALGNGPAGLVTLYDFCRMVDAGETPPAEMLQACSRAFKQILRTDDVDTGLMLFADELKLRKTKTRYKTAEAAGKELALVLEVLLLERDGMKASKAKKEIAKARRKSLRRIQDYYKEHEANARWFLDNFKI